MDDYFYMRNRTSDVLDYLQQEEKYVCRALRMVWHRLSVVVDTPCKSRETRSR